MRCYDLYCSCGWSEDDVLLRHAERAAARCPECEGELRHRIGVPAVLGLAKVKSFGMTFENERAATQFMGQGDVLEGSEKTRFIDNAREKGEKAAQAMGYRDMEHRSEDCKQITRDQQRIAREGRKPFAMPKV